MLKDRLTLISNIKDLSISIILLSIIINELYSKLIWFSFYINLTVIASHYHANIVNEKYYIQVILKGQETLLIESLDWDAF